MKHILTLLLALIPVCTYAQQGGVSPQDAARLDKIWKTFLDGISRRDTVALRAISLDTVSCVPCVTAADKSYIPASRFFTTALTWPGKPFWQVITGKKYWVNTIVTSGRPENVTSTQKHFVIYEMSFVTSEPGAIAPGNGGVSHLFQFIEVGGALRFYGLAMVR